MRDLQSANEREYRYIFIVVENLGKLALEVANVGLEVVTLPHFGGEEAWLFFLASPRETY